MLKRIKKLTAWQWFRIAFAAAMIIWVGWAINKTAQIKAEDEIYRQKAIATRIAEAAIPYCEREVNGVKVRIDKLRILRVPEGDGWMDYSCSGGRSHTALQGKLGGFAEGHIEVTGRMGFDVGTPVVGEMITLDNGEKYENCFLQNPIDGGVVEKGVIRPWPGQVREVPACTE